MPIGISLPPICAAERCFFAHCFAYLAAIMNHPVLLEEEKYVGFWLAFHSTNSPSFSCLYSYKQISLALNKPCEKVHRILTRLRVMGFLIADLPIHYEKLTDAMVHKEYALKLILPERKLVLSYHPDRKPITLNLLKNLKEAKRTKNFSASV